MKILITGASGLLGKALCGHLAADHDIYTLVRNHQKTNQHAFFWNPEAGELNPESLTGMDAVIHLAAESVAEGRLNAVKKQRVLDSRVKGTALLAQAMAHHPTPPKVFISASAIGYYGHRGNVSLAEDAAPGQDFLAEVCQQWEAASQIQDQPAIRVVQLRIGVVLTPTGGALAKMAPLFRLGLAGPLGHGHQYFSWISLRDTVRAIEYCLTNAEITGPVNVVAPRAVTNTQFTKALARVLHRPAWLRVPAPILRLAVGELADLALLSSTRVEPAKLLASGFMFNDPDLEPALHQLLDP